MAGKILPGPYFEEPGTYESTALKKFLQIEQPVGDISNLFLKVTYGLDELNDSTYTSGASTLTRLWDGHCQDFLMLAADSRKNMYIAVAIMDVCNDGIHDSFATSPVSDETGRAIHTAVKLIARNAERGRRAADELKDLAQVVRRFNNHIRTIYAQDGVWMATMRALVRSSSSFYTATFNVGQYRQEVTLVPVEHTPESTDKASKIGNAASCPLSTTADLPAFRPRPSGAYKCSGPMPTTRTSTAPNHHSRNAGTLTARREMLTQDVEKIADRIQEYAAIWSTLASQIEAWSAYLSQRAGDMQRTLGGDKLLHEVAGMWDAIMDMKHAAIIRRSFDGSPDYTHSRTHVTSSTSSR
ncbi:hypothetical protein BV20DRAFT_94253 [Pilatotrama ljubarskyi]|nr:hypothetical protein BV20DRAFT_94253 [Pilatotrama ljubarskyi]